jgi:hypothetical protein
MLPQSHATHERPLQPKGGSEAHPGAQSIHSNSLITAAIKAEAATTQSLQQKMLVEQGHGGS